MFCHGADPTYPLGSAVTQLSNLVLLHNRLTNSDLFPKSLTTKRIFVFDCYVAYVTCGPRDQRPQGSPGTELGSSTKASALDFWVFSAATPQKVKNFLSCTNF